MKKRFKNMDGDNIIAISIRKSGKGELFRLNPHLCTHFNSLYSMSYSGNSVYKTVSYDVPTIIQWFWIGLIFEIIIYKRKLSEGRMISYEDSQFAAINDFLNNQKQ